ncbi:MAG: hypothetical protein GY854_16260 [Deltaproteobacteria bacterium]|nr:hypothetical protein [Deltaproteobacteria bacterium]
MQIAAEKQNWGGRVYCCLFIAALLGLSTTGCIKYVHVDAGGGVPISVGEGAGGSKSTGKAIVTGRLGFSSGFDHEFLGGFWHSLGFRYSHQWLDNTAGDSTIKMTRTQFSLLDYMIGWSVTDWFIPAVSIPVGLDFRKFEGGNGYESMVYFGAGVHFRFYPLITSSNNFALVLSPAIEVHWTFPEGQKIGGAASFPIMMHIGFEFS